MANANEITELLQAASSGDRGASDALFHTVYRELRVIARAHRRRWTGNPTLNTTALIHEAYVKLAGQQLAGYHDRTHFFATASKAMRQILISYARRVATTRRGGHLQKVTLADFSAASESTFEDLLAIDDLLVQLEKRNPRHCRLVEYRVFGGMTVDETATALGVSPATVKRDWTVVSAWLYREVSHGRNKNRG